MIKQILSRLPTEADVRRDYPLTTISLGSRRPGPITREDVKGYIAYAWYLAAIFALGAIYLAVTDDLGHWHFFRWGLLQSLLDMLGL